MNQFLCAGDEPVHPRLAALDGPGGCRHGFPRPERVAEGQQRAHPDRLLPRPHGRRGQVNQPLLRGHDVHAASRGLPARGAPHWPRPGILPA
eukprot:6931222-Pyramimonas_sp.AAC.1